jgi:hypothetical protein
MNESWNARIKSTQLGYGHGSLTFFLNMEFKGTGQGFGGHRIEGPYAAKAIKSILDTVGVGSWEELPGKFVVCHGNSLKIEGISNIVDDSRTFFLSNLSGD